MAIYYKNIPRSIWRENFKSPSSQKDKANTHECAVGVQLNKAKKWRDIDVYDTVSGIRLIKYRESHVLFDASPENATSPTIISYAEYACLIWDARVYIFEEYEMLPDLPRKPPRLSLKWHGNENTLYSLISKKENRCRKALMMVIASERGTDLSRIISRRYEGDGRHEIEERSGSGKYKSWLLKWYHASYLIENIEERNKWETGSEEAYHRSIKKICNRKELSHKKKYQY